MTNKDIRDIVNLRLYFFDTKGNLQRTIETTCELDRSLSMPRIIITDHLVSRLIGKDSLPFYDVDTHRFNFYADDIPAIMDATKDHPQIITIEMMDIGPIIQGCVLLSPGEVIIETAGDQDHLITMYRVHDDTELYSIVNKMPTDILTDTDNFCKVFLSTWNDIHSQDIINAEKDNLNVFNYVCPNEIKQRDIDDIEALYPNFMCVYCNEHASINSRNFNKIINDRIAKKKSDVLGDKINPKYTEGQKLKKNTVYGGFGKPLIAFARRRRRHHK